MQTKSIPYTFIRGGYFYFSRRVPNDLRKYYSYPRVVQGLRTSSPQKAKVQANVAAAKLEAYWSQMRLAESEVLGMSLVKEIPASNALAIPSLSESMSSSQADCLSLLDALKVYLDLKGKGRPKTFHTAAERSCNYLVSLCGNKPLSKYTRNDALQFRDWLVARGLTGSSVTRNFSYLKAVINFALSEYALDMRNPFVGVYHDRNAGVLVRKPIPLDAIRDVQAECLTIDDDMRWLIALISDTGMRLAEGAGLLKQDIVGLETTQPYINLIKHPWRNLKTASSERKIPLVGKALWAAKRIVEADKQTDFAFPRYNRNQFTTANSASSALNKWLRQYVPSGCTLHSFRHSMRDRLRETQCPFENTGWSETSDDRKGFFNASVSSSPSALNNFYLNAGAADLGFAAYSMPTLSGIQGGDGFNLGLNMGEGFLTTSFTQTNLSNNLDNEVQSSFITSYQREISKDLTYSLMFGLADEGSKFLGMTGGGAFDLEGSKSNTSLAGAKVRFGVGEASSIGFMAAISKSELSENNQGFVTGIDNVTADTFALSFDTFNVFGNDKLSVSLSQPHRVNSGTMGMQIAGLADSDGNIPYTYHDISLTPSGRQVDLSIGYSKDISKNTTIGARFIHTKEAGHVKSAQDENSIFAGIKYKNLNLGGSYVDVSNRVEAEINYTIRW